MAVKALNLSHRIRYTPERDPEYGEPGATVYVLAPLDSRLYGVVMDMASSTQVRTDGGNETVRVEAYEHKVHWHAVQYSLREVSNLIGEDGSPVEFKTVRRNIGGREYTIVDPALMSLIPGFDVSEMARRVLDASRLGPELGNGSGSPG